MKNIVYLGAKAIGLECLKILEKNANRLDYKIIGVLTNNRGEEIKKYCETNKLPLIDSLEEYLNLTEKVDIAISVQYHKILKKEHIEKAKDITINLHMAPLPEYRGCNQFSFAILDGVNEFGTTIHRLEEGIDSGGIIKERRFKISKNIWVRELYEKTFNESLMLFKETLPNLISGEYKVVQQKYFLKERKTSLHFRKEINDIKIIDLNWPMEKIMKHVRATYMPGFEPPYFIFDGKKIYFKREDY